MNRDISLFIEDILESIDAIEDFSKDMGEEEIKTNRMKQSAIVREIEIIGEAVKNIPDYFKNKHKEVEWRKIAGMRDIIVHNYFKMDLNAVWNVINKDIPVLRKQMTKIRDELEQKR